MRWSFFALAGLMGLSAAAPLANAAEDYAVLIISRERLEVPTNCEIGLYLNDQLAGRLFQEQATSFNLPAGNLSLRLKLLPGQSPGCLPGLLAPPAQNITLKAGDVRKLRIAQGPDTLLDHTINGYNGMPPMGLCVQCSEEQFLGLISFMSGQHIQ